MRAEDALAADLREARPAILPTTEDPQDILDRWAVELADDAGDDPPIAMRTRSRAPTGTALHAGVGLDGWMRVWMRVSPLRHLPRCSRTHLRPNNNVDFGYEYP